MRLLCACYAGGMRLLCVRYASAMRLLCGCYAGVCPAGVCLVVGPLWAGRRASLAWSRPEHGGGEYDTLPRVVPSPQKPTRLVAWDRPSNLTGTFFL